MELKISVSEAVELIKEIKTMPEKIFNYIESSLRESVGSFLSGLMQQELTVHLGRQRYERKQDSKNYRNGTYPREFYLKNIGQVEVKNLWLLQLLDYIERYKILQNQDL
jgi:transposase-like protein